MGSRACDKCGSRMPPFFPRQRVGDELWCRGCVEIAATFEPLAVTASAEWRVERRQIQTHNGLVESLAVHVAQVGDVTAEVIEGPYVLTIGGGNRYIWGVGRGDEDFGSGDAATLEEAKAAALALAVTIPAGQMEGQMPMFAKLKQALKIAHDSGDGETLYHCPFCGAGQLTGRSDGTAECQFCGTAFTVQVQPKHNTMPQTIDGVPQQMPDMPGGPGEPGEPVEEEVVEETEMDLGADSEGDVKPNPFTSKQAGALDWYDVSVLRRGDEVMVIEHGTLDLVEAVQFAKRLVAESEGVGTGTVVDVKVINRGSGDVFWSSRGGPNPDARFASKQVRYYLNAEGVAMPEESYLRHLALKYADDRQAVLADIRAERGLGR